MTRACIAAGAIAPATVTAVAKPSMPCRFFEQTREANSATLTKGWKKHVGSGDSSMATQIVMDRSGDTRHQFDADDLKSLAEAERRFNALTGAGFTAATRRANGELSLAHSFNPNTEETLFYPRLVGG